jgi:methionine-rich copper-binding protein CopC
MLERGRRVVLAGGADALQSVPGDPRLDSGLVTTARRLLVIAAALVVGAIAAPTAVLAHAALVSSTPADGARVSSAQAAVVALEFDEDLDPTRSTFEVVPGGGGDALATGGPSADDLKAMSVGGLALAPGSYEVRWTAWTTSDGHMTRGIVSFLVVADAASASPAPSSAAVPSPAAAASVAPSALASPAALATATAASTAVASPVAPGSAPTAVTGSEVVLPIVAGLVVVIVLAVGLLRPDKAE